MRNVTGQIVEGADFFDREHEMARFWDGLDTDSLLLLAPRRVGKSSIMRRMDARAGEHDFTSILVDVSDCSDELHFVQRLYTAVLERHGSAERLWNRFKTSWAGRTIGRVEKVGVKGLVDLQFSPNDFRWQKLGEELADALEGLEGRTLLQIDELPVFLLKLLGGSEDAGRGRVREFLYWQRRMRQTYLDVRWLLAGSIGLDTVASRLNIADSINDLRIVTVGAFDRATSHKFLEKLSGSYGIELSEGVREYILDRIGWLIPFYQQLIFDEIRKLTTVKPTNEDVDRALDELLQPHNKTKFDYWRQRLWDELGRPEAEYAKTALDAVCRGPEGVRRGVLLLALEGSIADAAVRDDKLRYLLDVLQNDGYVTEEGGRWRFRSPILREYWLRRVAPPEASHG